MTYFNKDLKEFVFRMAVRPMLTPDYGEILDVPNYDVMITHSSNWMCTVIVESSYFDALEKFKAICLTEWCKMHFDY